MYVHTFNIIVCLICFIVTIPLGGLAINSESYLQYDDMFITITNTLYKKINNLNTPFILNLLTLIPIVMLIIAGFIRTETIENRIIKKLFKGLDGLATVISFIFYLAATILYFINGNNICQNNNCCIIDNKYFISLLMATIFNTVSMTLTIIFT